MQFTRKMQAVLKTSYPITAEGYLAKDGDTPAGTKQFIIPFIKASNVTFDDENYWTSIQSFNDRIRDLLDIENDSYSNKLTVEAVTEEGE